MSTNLDTALTSGIDPAEYDIPFSETSNVSLLEASRDGRGITQIDLDDATLAQKLEMISSEAMTDTSVKIRTFFIPWAIHDSRMAITPRSFTKLCDTLSVCALLIENIVHSAYWAKPGNGFFLRRDENGEYKRLEIFYRYEFGKNSGRAYISTSYDFLRKLTTNVCVNFIPNVFAPYQNSAFQAATSSAEQPLSLHIMLAFHALEHEISGGSQLRRELLNDELGPAKNPKIQTRDLHVLSQRLHILMESLIDLEERIEFLIGVAEEMSNIVTSYDPASDLSKLQYVHSKTRTTRRWISNYRDRVNIRINLAFHISSQLDNDINLRISKATTEIARDAQRDSSSMITIAAVTMFFLPGTFVCAVFSMTFFNFQQDDSGTQQFQISNRWWYFLTVTIPLTIVVFGVWIFWQRWRVRKLEREF